MRNAVESMRQLDSTSQSQNKSQLAQTNRAMLCIMANVLQTKVGACESQAPYSTLFCKGVRMSLKIRVLPSGNLSCTLNFARFFRCFSSTIASVVHLVRPSQQMEVPSFLETFELPSRTTQNKQSVATVTKITRSFQPFQQITHPLVMDRRTPEPTACVARQKLFFQNCRTSLGLQIYFS